MKKELNNTSKRLIKYARPHKLVLGLALSSMLLSGLVGILPSWFVKITIDGLNAIQDGKEYFNILPQQLLSDTSEITRLLFSSTFFTELFNSGLFVWKSAQLHLILPMTIIIVFGCEAVFKFNYQYFTRKLGLLVVKQMREDYHQKINAMSIANQRKYDSGSLVSVITSDLQSLQSWIAESLMNLFSEIFKAVFLFSWLLFLNWKLTVISAITIPFFAIPVIKLGKGIRSYSRQGQDFVGTISSFINETIRNQSIIKSFNLEEWRQKNFIKESKFLHELFDKLIFTMALVSPLTNLIGAVGIAAILFFGLKTVTGGMLTIGEFSSFFVTSILLYDPVKRLGRVATIFQSALGVADRVFTILDEPDQESAEKKNFTRITNKLEGNISFRDLKFSYGEKNIFDGLNLEIKAGESIALVGPSGGGKTSLVSLIPRFYELESGSITIDGNDISRLTLKDLRKQIALVTQEPLLFTGSLRENILLGSELYHNNTKPKDLDELLQKAVENSFISNFAQDLDMQIGEGGSRLSIGQRQRLSLARAFISEAPIIILDEPTSALDNESQEFIYKSIEKLKANRTLIIIAHRLDTVKSCDRIVYIQDGKIIEDGSHEELIAKGTAYSGLLKA
jgi:ATP-binding cassette, subfamily B, bacterial MsbA